MRTSGGVQPLQENEMVSVEIRSPLTTHWNGLGTDMIIICTQMTLFVPALNLVWTRLSVANGATCTPSPGRLLLMNVDFVSKEFFDPKQNEVFARVHRVFRDPKLGTKYRLSGTGSGRKMGHMPLLGMAADPKDDIPFCLHRT